MTYADFDGAGCGWLGGVWEAKPGGLEPLWSSAAADRRYEVLIGRAGAVEKMAARDEEAARITALRIDRGLLVSLELPSSVPNDDERSAKDTHVCE